jgi:hypothetical protein
MASDKGPRADGPLINNAAGNFFYFAIIWSRAEHSSESDHLFRVKATICSG